LCFETEELSVSQENNNNDDDRKKKSGSLCCLKKKSTNQLPVNQDGTIVDMDKFLEEPDPKKHRVWYQVMTFSPKAILKNFNNLNLFKHELSHLPPNALVLTLRSGNGLDNDHIECRVPLKAGHKVHGQRHQLRIPGLAQSENQGFRTLTVLATNEVTCKGLHGVDMRAKGILPWGPRAIERNVLVPEAIDEIVFNYPALRIQSTDTPVILALLPKKDRIIEEAKRKNRRYLGRTIYPISIDLNSSKYKYRPLFSQKKVNHLCHPKQNMICCSSSMSNKNNKNDHPDHPDDHEDDHQDEESESQHQKDEILKNESKMKIDQNENQSRNESRKLFHRKLLVPHLGKFDISSTESNYSEKNKEQRQQPLNVDFPALEPASHHVPPALSGLNEKRLQVGWVLIELPSSSTSTSTIPTSTSDSSSSNNNVHNNIPPVYMRLPAYVMGRNVSLACLPPNDQASASWRLAPNTNELDDNDNDADNKAAKQGKEDVDKEATQTCQSEQTYHRRESDMIRRKPTGFISQFEMIASKAAQYKNQNSNSNSNVKTATHASSDSQDENNINNEKVQEEEEEEEEEGKAGGGGEKKDNSECPKNTNEPKFLEVSTDVSADDNINKKKKSGNRWCFGRSNKQHLTKHQKAFLKHSILRAMAYKLSKAFDAWRAKIVMFKLMAMMGDDDDDDDDD